MMLYHQGQLQTLNGTVAFISAFHNSSAKVRRQAHKHLIEELRQRGYFPNGKNYLLPEKEHEENSLHVPEILNTNSFENALEKIDKYIIQITERLTALKQDMTADITTFYQNPKTGQKILIEDLTVATGLWPLNEVLELIP